MTPFVMRLGMDQVGGQGRRVPDSTADEFLPCVVEVSRGIVVQSGTRLTEVKRETTDDN